MEDCIMEDCAMEDYIGGENNGENLQFKVKEDLNFRSEIERVPA